MAERTFSWIQNPSSVSNLKKTVAAFVLDSPTNVNLRFELLPRLIDDEMIRARFIEELSNANMSIPYNDLKGKGPGSGSRRDAPCSGIIQAAITPQGVDRQYTDDWTADGFLRWAVSIGFLDYCRESDCCSITEIGRRFVNTEGDSYQENEILRDAYLSYPPAIRILKLLKQFGHQTKFELGSRLGFIGEAGFTSIPQNLYIAALCEASGNERDRIRSNIEGSSDKYARMIAGWLIRVGWVSRTPKTVDTIVGEKSFSAKIAHAYEITLAGREILNHASGSSRHSQKPRLVLYEMLATKPEDKEYLRKRRALIIQYINKSYRSLQDIQNFLHEKGFELSVATIQDELTGLEYIGLNVKKDSQGKYRILDTIIGLSIPASSSVVISDITKTKDLVCERLKHVNHKYLSLIDLAVDGNANREFEMLTIDLLTNELEYEGVRLGESRKPDGIVSYQNQGVIIDNKAYSKGYRLPISQADEMARYIEENQRRDVSLNSNSWWDNFNKNVETFYFLFISSQFTGNFKQQLEYIAQRVQIKGGAITAVNLLYFAEKLKSGNMTYPDSFRLFANAEIEINP